METAPMLADGEVEVTSLDRKKLNIITWVSLLNNGEVLNRLAEIQQEVAQQDGEWSTISDAARRSIELGHRDIALGKTKPHAEVMKKYAQWL